MVTVSPPSNKQPWQQLRRRSRVLWRLGFLTAGIGLGAVIGGQLIPLKAPKPIEDLQPAISRLADPPGRPQTLLLLGLDSEKINAKNQALAQVQLLLMARVHPAGGLELLQIPSELAVLLPGQQKLRPLTDLYRQGGVALIADVVAQLLANGGEPVLPDRYLLLPRGAMQEAINGIGGLPFNIETAMRYQDKKSKLKIELEAGQQWLGGAQLDQLLRFQGPDQGDSGRRQRQQQLVLPLAERLADPNVVPKLPALLLGLRSKFDTNLGHGEMLSLLAAGLKNPDLISISRLPLSRTSGPRRLDQQRATPILELWHQGQRPTSENSLINLEGAEGESTTRALELLQGSGLIAQLSSNSAEQQRQRTLILHGRNSKQALAVRKVLGVGELQRGPMSPGAEVEVLLGKDWLVKKP